MERNSITFSLVTDELTSRSRGLTTSRGLTSRLAGTSIGTVPSEENSLAELNGKRDRAPGELLNQWMLPASWVPKIVVSREAFDTRWVSPTCFR